MSKPRIHPLDVRYPESDGKPMAETDLHRQLLIDLVWAADHHFRQDPEVYVSGNLLLYYVEGDPRRSVAPDVFVVRGVRRGLRRTFKVWEEGKGPDVVIELSSDSTYREDLERKPAIYAVMGVREYYVFDPEGLHVVPPFRSFRLQDGELREISPAREEEETRVFTSDVLGLELHASGSSLRWVDPATGSPIPVPAESLDLATTAQRRAAQALARELDARARAERADTRAERAEDRSRQLEAEVARLRDELARSKGRSG